MNYFTKEELHEIKIALICYGLGECGSILFSKIQSLIDNYCEHEWENVCCGCSLSSLWCDKCDKNLTEI